MSYDLKIGFACNNNCVHCVISDKAFSGDLSLQQLKSIIDKDIKQGEQVVVTGGEPTLRKDFIEILKYLNETKEAKIVLQTNGRGLSDENIARESVKYVDWYLIAIHSHNKFIHEMITERKNSFDETIQGVRNINKYLTPKNQIHSQTVLSKLNVDNLLATYDFIFEDLGIKAMNMTFPHPMGNAMKNFNIVVPQYHTIKKSIQKCFEKYGKYLHTEAIPLCYIHPYVNEVYYSEKDRINKSDRRGHDHSIKNDSIENYNEIILKEYRKTESCKECIYNYKCIGVWKEYYEGYKDSMDLFPIREQK